MIAFFKKISESKSAPCQSIIKLIFCAILLFFTSNAFAQAELMPWGNLTGIRISGQLMDFNTTLNVVGAGGWSEIKYSGKELQKPKFNRVANIQTVKTEINGIEFTETVTDLSDGVVRIIVKSVAQEDINLTGVFIGVKWNRLNYTGKNHFEISPLDSAKIVEHKNFTETFLPIHTGFFKKGVVYEKAFTISVSGEIDAAPAEINLNASIKGRPFAGVGGNFRLQNSKLDPQVIDYCLANMRVAWGRVEMPWRNWQAALNIDPAAAAKNGNLDPHVEKSMQMAQRLAEMNIPVIVSAWSPPDWAIIGKAHNGATPEGIWGNPLNQERIQQIYKSITDYLLYLKANYNTEATYFSFNESDLGINVRQTGQEHAQLIKGLGAYFKSKGLKTKLLLGDNSDANTYSFIYPALNDPECRPYIGAISFHSWRGWETKTLQKWAEAAAKINVPLIVGEGSIDAAAWQYPAYFEEESYALEEVNLYVRLLAICQPLSILQWQLTADYSPLTGGGIFGNSGPLKPTQRFWQLKQLAAIKANERHIVATSSRPDISVAALAGEGNNCTIQIVNNSAGRKVNLSGLPKNLKKLKIVVTDRTRNMSPEKDIQVKNGKANFYLNARCFVTLEGR
ncbi:hypothetical protein ACVWYG_003859 [Pedobacter sp. UYEF25]